MKKRLTVICILTAMLIGCKSRDLETSSENTIAGDYTFSQYSRYSGKTVKILAEGEKLFIEMEGQKIELKPDGDYFRFTTGDMVWNNDRTAMVQEWFMIAYDAEKKQYYMGSPDNAQWRQYLIKN